MPEAKFWVPFLKWDAFVADSPEQIGGDEDTDPDKRGIHGGCRVTASLTKGDIRAVRANLPVTQLFALGEQEVRLDDGLLKLTASQQEFGLLGKSAVLELPDDVDLVYTFTFHHVNYNGGRQDLPAITVKAPVIPEDHDPEVDGPLVLNLAELEWLNPSTSRSSGYIIRAVPDDWDYGDDHELRFFANGEEIGEGKTVPFDEIVGVEIDTQLPGALAAAAPGAVTADLAGRVFSWEDAGDGEGYPAVGGTPIGPARPWPAAAWSGVAGRPTVLDGTDTADEVREAIGLKQTLGVIVLADDGVTDNLAALHAALAEYQYVQIAPSASGTGVLGLAGMCTIPTVTTLEIHRAIDVKMLSGNATSVFRLSDGAGLIVKGAIDGNLDARELSGDLTTYTWGYSTLNASGTFVEVDTVRDVGCTDAYMTASGAMGGGGVIAHNASATKHTENNRHRIRRIEGNRHGFMMRISSDFLDVAEEDSDYYCHNNTIYAPHGPGGRKNAVELVGPHTRRNDVYGGLAVNPTGQGGYEQDLGAYDNTFHSPVIHFTEPFAGNEFDTFDAFSSRTVDLGDGKLKEGRGAKFLNPKIIVDTDSLVPADFFFRVCCVWGKGTDVRFDDLEVQGSIVGSGSGYAALLACRPDLGAVDRIEINRPRVDSIQHMLRVTDGDAGLLKFTGGYVKHTHTAMNISSVVMVERLVLRDITVESTNTAVNGDRIWTTDVDQCDFVGQTENTLIQPSMDGAVMRYGRNTFRCGGDSNSPVSAVSGRSGYLIDEGANVYTRRAPGSATSGGNGRVRSSGANVRRWTALSSAEQQAIARRTNTPTAGTWHQADQWLQSTPAASGQLGGVCTEGGTYGTYSSTASTTSGSPTITVASASGLKVGDWISVAGAVTRSRVLTIVGTTITLAGNASATVAGAATAHVAPVWKSLGTIPA